jgi:hypothetical protein
VKKNIILLLLLVAFSQAAMAMEKSNKDSITKRQAWLDSMLKKTIEEGHFNDFSIVEDLLKKKANPNCACEDNITLLHTAASKGRIIICRLLLQYKADVNAHEPCNQTPLMWATSNMTDGIEDNNYKKLRQDNEFELCKLLLAHNAQIDLQDINGMTALAFVSQTTNELVLKLLCANGADLKIRDRLSKHPLTLSVMLDRDCRILIVNSQFYPRYSPLELRKAQVRTRARLWALKKIYPRLTNDCKELILKSNTEIWQDACCTPLKMHTKKSDRIILMPIPILRIFLNRDILQNNAFDPIKTIRLLARYKMKQLEPLMRDAQQECVTRNLKENLRKMVDPSTLEEQYGNEIRDNIQAKLQIDPPHQESASMCTMQ